MQERERLSVAAGKLDYDTQGDVKDDGDNGEQCHGVFLLYLL